MKVTFDDHIRTLSGKSHDGLYVFCSYKNDTICVRRKYVRPRITAHNRVYGSKFAKIGLLWRNVPESFKQSLRVYAQMYNRQLLPEKKLPLNMYNIFIKALCKGIVSLDMLDNIENVIAMYGSTVAEWIQNGLLDRVKGSVGSSFSVSVVGR